MRPLLLVPGILAMGGCFLLDDRGGGGSRSRGSLSSALGKSRDGATDRVVDTRGPRQDGHRESPAHAYRHEAAPRTDNPGVTTTFASTAPATQAFDQDDTRNTLGITAYYVHVNDRYFNNMVGMGPVFKVQELLPRVSCGLFIVGEVYDLKADGAFALGAKDVYGICGGGELRYHLNDAKVFASPFLGAGLGFGSLCWTYRNALVDRDGQTVGGDSLGFVQVEVFAGVEFWRRAGLNASAQLGGLFRAYSGQTGSGFNNDLLPGHAGVKGGVMLGYTF